MNFRNIDDTPSSHNFADCCEALLQQRDKASNGVAHPAAPASNLKTDVSAMSSPSRPVADGSSALPVPLPQTAQLEADIDDIRTFLRVVFVGIEQSCGHISPRAFNNADAASAAVWWLPFGSGLASALRDLATKIANWTGDQAAVLAPPACVFGNQSFRGKLLATESNVIASRVIVLELDERPQQMLADAKGILGEPTLLVQSGGLWDGPNGPEPKLHVYWRLSETATAPEERERLKAVRKGIALLCGGDTSAAPLSHPLRLPGSLHTKGEPRPCKIVKVIEREISLADAEAYVALAADIRGVDLTQTVGPRRARDGGFKTTRSLTAAALEMLASSVPNPAGLSWDDWNTRGMAFFDASHGSPEGLVAFDTYSRKNAKYDPENVEHRWDHYGRSPPSDLSAGTLVHLAKKCVPGFRLAPDVDAWFDKTAATQAPPQLTKESIPLHEVEPVDIFGDADPLQLAEPPPGSMPSILEPWARDEARRKGVPVALTALAGLSVIGAAIGCSLKIRPKLHDDREEPGALWVVIVADPGKAKSPVISAAMDPLRRLDRERYRADKARHDAWAAKKRPKGSLCTEPEPKIRRCVVDDATMEMQVRIHADNPRGIMRAPDEVVGLFGSLGAYKKGAQVDRSLVLRLFDGGPITVDRVNGGNKHADSGLMGILAGTQPDIVRTLVRDLGEDGLLQRFLFILHDDQQRQEFDEPPDRSAAAAYADAVRTLGTAEYSVNTVELSRDAYELLEREQANIRMMADLPGASKAWQGHISKWGKILPRLVLIFHALDHVAAIGSVLPGVKVERACAERAALFARFVLRHSLRFYETFFDASAVASEAREIAGYILTKPEIAQLTRRNIYDARKSLRGPENVRTLLSTMRELESAAWCEAIEADAQGSKVWRINPAVHVRFADRAKRELEDRRRRRERLIAAGKKRSGWLNADDLSAGDGSCAI